MVIPEQRKEDLYKAIDLYLKIYQEGKVELKSEFSKYSGYYYITNEPIRDIFDIRTKYENKKILSVLAGGDHIFEMIFKGASNVDTFDINALLEYYTIGFRKRAIECLDYQNYLELFDFSYNGLEQNYYNIKTEIEDYVVENMDEEYKWFWKEVKRILKEYGYEASVFHFALNIKQKDFNKPSFLKSEDNYKILQSKLQSATINFQQANIIELPIKFSKYDLIYLSNILDYREQEFAKILLTDIYNNNLYKNGQIIFTDLCSYFDEEIYESVPGAEKIKRWFDNPGLPCYGLKKRRIK